ncbi:hypothetical protein LAZ67_4003762, partial [Cordylochernes scorpioides]
MSRDERILQRKLSCQIRRIDGFIETVDSIIEAGETVRLEIMGEELKEIKEKIEKLYDELFSLDEVDMDKESEAYDSSRNKIGSLRVKIENKRKLKDKLADIKPNGSQANIKLPQFDLPIYDGDMGTWINFKELFLTTIDAHPGLTNIQKLQYLNSAVKGEAARLIRGFPLLNENYGQAWSTLLSRFDNPRELAYAQVSKIFSLRAIKNPSAKCLHEFMDVCNEAIRNLETLELKRNQLVDVILVHFLQQKLSENLRLDWELSVDNTLPSYDKFIAFISRHARSMSFAVKECSKKEETTGSRFPKCQSYGMLIESSDTCILCKSKHHPLYMCNLFCKMPLKEKLNVVKSHKLCFNCLRKGHFSWNCRLNQRCKVCKGKHHTMIHYDKPSTEGASAQVENTTPKEHESAINLTNTQQANCNDSHVLLATAGIKIKNELGKLCTCRALLDSGSQVTMITKGCCERLGLVQRKSDRMIIGVGNTPVQHSSSTVSVTFCPLNNSEEFSVEAVVTGVLTSEIPNFRLKDPNWPTLKNLKLADPEFYIQAPIDMILGADIYTELMLNGPISLGEGLPMAINTRLGWVLLGKLMGTSESNTEVNSALTGFHLPDFGVLHLLMYADDIAIIGESKINLQIKINLLKSYLDKNKLVLNENKSKIIVFRNGGRPARHENWYWGDTPLTVASNITYLGYPFTSTINSKKVALFYKAKANTAINATIRLIKKEKINSLKVALNLFDSVIKSILLYAAPVWAWDNTDIIDQLQNTFIKNFLNLPRYIPGYIVRLETGRISLTFTTIKLILKYFIRLQKMEDNRLPKLCWNRLKEISLMTKKPIGFCKNIMDIINHCGLTWLNYRLNYDDIQIELPTILKIKIEQLLQQDLAKLSLTKTYSNYRLLYDSFIPENYFSCNLSSALVSFIAQIRLMSTMIKENHIYAIKKEDLYCGLCGSQITDEIYHFIAECGDLEGERKKILKSLPRPHLNSIKLIKTVSDKKKVCNLSLQSEPELEFVMKRFWETESVPSPDLCTQDEDCESLFSNNHGRDSHGRYWVKLPFRQHRPLLGESREKALRRFLLLERKLCKNVKLYDQYRGFMKEYEHLNHMERVPIAEVKRELCRCYYMPHHPVIREQSTTTKMRVVFDPSAKSENNVSLNQFLHKGPKIQQDVFFILLRFRTYPVAITADIEEMYRQIRIHPEDADYQRILWRPSPEEPVVDYRLLTVTYGTTSAPFLAMRTLQQLAEDEGQNYPEASRVTLNDFYVDDLLTGAQTIAETKELIDQLKDLMKKGGFHLRKWNSNCHEIVSHVEEINEEKKINLEKGAISKILGIVWDHVQDTFRVNIILPEEVVTKRDLLSNIARIFDPIGFLSPTTVALKIIMQELWRGGTGWDEHIPNDIKEKWNNFRAELLKLEDLSIPRYVWACEKDRDVQLHGFCDASSVAYSAVCYLRTVSLDGQVHISMIVTKYSTFIKTRRIIAWCLRFITNCRVSLKKREIGTLSKKELENAVIRIIGWIQEDEFGEEMQDLRNTGHASRKSRILQLNPFIDASGMLRVGGRIQFRAKTAVQIMGNLPADRVNPSRPFTKTGVDLAGPYEIKPSLTRSKGMIKCYVILFVCFSVKAIHLEMVTSLSTSSFIAALRRGTESFMKKQYKIMNSKETKDLLAEEFIEWHFIPPSAPHFGGLWEANIKCLKGHLSKVIKSSLLNIEEFITLLCQVEACLNSRPLVELSPDPNDLRALTPGHFLIGSPLIEDPGLQNYERVDLRSRWTKEYINSLQQRNKWRFSQDNLKPNQILEVYPGSDQKVRVAQVRAATGVYLRPITKLAPLPFKSEPGFSGRG